MTTDRELLTAMVEDVPWWVAGLTQPNTYKAWMLFRCRELVYGFGECEETPADGLLH